MDKSWVNADRRSREFQIEVEELLLFVFENGYDENKISCPCLKCAHSKSWKATNSEEPSFSKWYRADLHLLDLARRVKYRTKSACYGDL